MIKEEKNIDFYTTGRQPTEQEFARISEWIKKDKARHASYKPRAVRKKDTSLRENAAAKGEEVSQHSHQ